MTYFYLAAATLVVAALALLLRPWRAAGRRSASADFSQTSLPALNTAIHRDRLNELERDRHNGTLSSTDLAEAREELQRQLLDDTAAIEVAVADGGSRKSAMAIALLLPVLAIAMYALLGSPAAVLPGEVQAQKATADMEVLTAKLAEKMKQNPDNPEGWAMLARSYKALGRWDEAEQAYLRIGPDLERSAEILAEFAELLLQKGNGFSERPRQMIKKALLLEPNNMLALFLGGGEAFDSGRYAEAATLWAKLLPQLDPDGEDARMVESSIAMARSRSGGGPAVVAGDVRPGTVAPQDDLHRRATSKSKTVENAGPQATGTSLQGRVELAAALKGKANPEDVVFIFARAVDGPRMPLAALRVRAGDLPMNFTLDDSQALVPEFKISSVQQLRVEVRISKSGKANPSPGDLTGKSAQVKPGAKGLKIVIDTIDP